MAEAIERDPPDPFAPLDQAVRHLAGTVYAAIENCLPSYYLILVDLRQFGAANLRRQLASRLEAAAKTGRGRDEPTTAPPPGTNPVGRLLARLPLRPGLDPAFFVRLLMASVVFTVIGQRFFGLPVMLPGGSLAPATASPQEELDRLCQVLLHGALETEAPGDRAQERK